MTGNNNPVSINDLKDKKTEHGALAGCSLSLGESGMMMNSNSHYYVSVDVNDGVQIITVRNKKAFEGETVSVYKAKTDVLGQVRELAERENMAAWGELKYIREYVVYDYSASAGMTLYYDDTALGGYKKTPVNIDLMAVRQQGAGAVEDEYRKILDEGIAAAELMSAEQGGSPFGMGKAAPVPDEQPAEGCWKCPCCGYAGNKGRFCSESGSQRP